VKAAVVQRARDLGFDECRFTTAEAPEHREAFTRWLTAQHHGEMMWIERNAHKRVDPQQVLANAKTIVTLAVSYAFPAEDLTNALTPNGVVARYARYTDYHDVLVEPLKALTCFINENADPGTQSLWYVDTGPLLERDLAQRAGIGFVGKHTNLISRELGNWFFLAEIITTARFEPDTGERNRCGTCTRCLTACPTKAITAPFELDARRCISYLTIELKGSIPVEFRRAIGNRIYGCDDCLAACPWNRFAQAGHLMQDHRRTDLDSPALLELLNLSDAEFKQKFAGSPILRTKRRGLLRNVCIALGNIGDRGALPALTKAANDAEPLIAEHARWAAEEIERRFSFRGITDIGAKAGAEKNKLW
jgi:epoxyqueuosine reductase